MRIYLYILILCLNGKRGRIMYLLKLKPIYKKYIKKKLFVCRLNDSFATVCDGDGGGGNGESHDSRIFLYIPYEPGQFGPECNQILSDFNHNSTNFHLFQSCFSIFSLNKCQTPNIILSFADNNWNPIKLITKRNSDESCHGLLY